MKLKEYFTSLCVVEGTVAGGLSLQSRVSVLIFIRVIFII